MVGRGNLIAVGQTSISGRRERRDERDEFDPISSYPLHPFPRKSRDSSSDGSFFLDLKGGGGDTSFIFHIDGNNRMRDSIHFDVYIHFLQINLKLKNRERVIKCIDSLNFDKKVIMA